MGLSMAPFLSVGKNVRDNEEVTYRLTRKGVEEFIELRHRSADFVSRQRDSMFGRRDTPGGSIKASHEPFFGENNLFTYVCVCVWVFMSIILIDFADESLREVLVSTKSTILDKFVRLGQVKYFFSFFFFFFNR